MILFLPASDRKYGEYKRHFKIEKDKRDTYMIKIEKALVSDTNEIMELIQHVHDNMENQQWYVIDSAEYYAHHLEDGKGIGYKAVDTNSGKLAGIFIAIIPETIETNLGYDIGFSEEKAKKVAVMDTVAILPEYRGQNLQYRTMQAAEMDLKDQGYQYLLCTVHPDNGFSLRNVQKQGYEIVMTKEKYGGFLRHILMKEI